MRIAEQARGLPHAHILIILANKILCARQIDAIISAEVPNPLTQPVLYAIVTKHMIHKPCDDNPAASCRLKGKQQGCFRRFPKELHAMTTTNGDGYPRYRRRALHTAVVGNRIVTDEWVVPYNALLLKMYNCHINCEISCHRRCFKYVYKYVFKVRCSYDRSVFIAPVHISPGTRSCSHWFERNFSVFERAIALGQ